MKNNTFTKKIYDSQVEADVNEEVGGTVLNDAEFVEKCTRRGDIFTIEKRSRRGLLLAAGIFLALAVTAGVIFISRTENIDVSADYFERLPDERGAKFVKMDEVEATIGSDGTDTRKLKPTGNAATGVSSGGGDPRSRVTNQGVLGVVSGQIKGKTVAPADVFGSGGFATDIDATLSGVGGLKAGNDGGAGRNGGAGIGYGSGYGSSFGGGHLDGLSGGSRSSYRSGTIHSYNSERNESYSTFAENRFKDARVEPLSTFSLDVDVASYSNMRRMINQGQKPAKDAVRIEQLVNYFSYDYPAPNGKHPISVMTETQKSPWNKDHLLVRIGVKAKEVPTKDIPASNFVFLIDVSGSMYSPNRLPLVKSSLKLLTNNLRDKDRVAIVVYASSTGQVLPSTPGSDKQKIFEALDGLTAGGSTAGGDGIHLAYKVAQKNFIKGGNNRVILCTDGDFNVGVSSTKELEDLITEKRKTGVYLTVLGYGMGNYKDDMLQTLSQKGNGNHAYIDNLQEANRVLVQEFGSTMYAVAKDVKMQVEFNPAYVNAYRLVGYESRLLAKEDFNDDTKDAGELGAGHTVTAFYEIIPVGVKNTFGSVDELKYQKPAISESAAGVQNNEMMNVKIRYKPLTSDKSVLMQSPVLVSDTGKSPSADFHFAAAVAMFGQLLRDSDFKGKSSYNDVVTLARKGLNNDQHGYRREFVRLAEATKQLVN